MKYALSPRDAAFGPRRLGPDRDRIAPLEVQIPLDPHAEGQPNRCHLAQRPGAELRIAQIGEAEQDVAVFVELGGKPGACAEGLKNFTTGM